VSNCILTKVLMRTKSKPKENRKYKHSNELGLVERVCSDLERITNRNDSISNTLAAEIDVCVLTGGWIIHSRRRPIRRIKRTIR